MNEIMKSMTDEEYFGVDKHGYLELLVGKTKPNNSNIIKVRHKNLARPIYMSYEDLIGYNIRLEMLIESEDREDFEKWYSQLCKTNLK